MSSKLLELSDIDPLTTHVLLGTLYFKGEWKEQFKVKNTKSDVFYGLTQRNEMLMNQYSVKHSYCETKKEQWLEMEYLGDRLVMGFCLPKNEKENPANGMLSIPLPTDFESTKLGTVTIPKFTHRIRVNLAPVMADKLGLKPLFEFSNDDKKGRWQELTDENVCITKIIHEAVIIVDEVGTEAAAATAVTFGVRSMAAPPKKNFIANRSFSYYIRDKIENVVFFQGLYV